MSMLREPGSYAVLAGKAWNSPVFWGFTSTALRLGGFILILPLALRHLSPDLLGIWYTMQGLGGLVLMIEIGFSPVIGRFASFYFAGATKVPSLGVEEKATPPNSQPNLPALAGLITLSRRLYRWFSFACFILMGLGGAFWLGRKFGDEFLQPGVLGPYVVYSLGLALMMSGFFWNDILFGTHQVRDFYRNLILAQVLNYVISGTLLLCGFGLTAMAAGQLVVALLPRWIARRQCLRLLPIEQVTTPQSIALKELWPMCWRSGVGSLGAFLLLRCITLVSAQVLDLPSTASLGLSLQLCVTVSGISQIWLSVTYPIMVRLRSQRNEVALHRVAQSRTLFCMATYAAGGTALLVLGPWSIDLMGSRTPLLPTPVFALLIAVCGLDLFVSVGNAIMLTGNRVPFLVPSLVSGAATAALALWLGRLYGLYGIILAPVIVQTLWIYWWTPLTAWRSMAVGMPKSEVV